MVEEIVSLKPHCSSLTTLKLNVKEDLVTQDAVEAIS